MTTVAQEDRSRVVLPSCPSNGWLSGVFRGSGLPNGQKLVNSPGKTNDTRPCTACQCGLSGCSEAESHGPYLGGSGFVTDEKGPGWNATTPERLVPIKLFEPKTPPILSISQTGVDKPGTFTSEFGAKTAVLHQCYIRAMILPRQARDKHRESTQKESGVFSQGRSR
jgi:hypothetical protein